ncbi:MAG: trypsin-like serine protease, partial [Planctomycetes bacterium]|nr:trypsin-like serine protease [Planctomycetota bacterium]
MFTQTGIRRAVVVVLAVVLLLVFCSGIPGGALAARQQALPAAVRSLDQLSLEFREVARRGEASVVRIEIRGTPRPASEDSLPGSPEEFFRRFFEAPFGGRADEPELPDSDDAQRYDVPRRVGAGSGWIYDRRGHVVTNHHVVRDAESVVVKLHDGRECPARVVATDAATDIALLVIEAGDLTPAVLSEGSLEQGDIVFAFGSPFEFEFSMSQGIVSGKGRRTGILGPSGYEDFIQTDAAINPGNSGGPLTNARAEVVGMNSSIVTGSGLFGGIGFAIPIAMIRPVVEQMIEFQAVRRGQLGIFIQDDPDVLKSFGYEGPGAVVSDVVPDGPADKAGIRAGDVVTRLDGQGVAGAAALRQA